MTFAVSGKLWQRSLVMLDMETKSLWGQLLGRAMDGPLEGQSLESLPSLMTDWESWRRNHPKTTVLMMSRTHTQFTREVYRDLRKWVIGMVEEGQSRAWPLDGLRQQPLVNDRVGHQPIVLIFDPVNITSYAYSRELGGQTLDFQSDGDRVTDRQTGSTWDGPSGRAIDGRLKGKMLKPLVTILSFRRPWEGFHPDSTIWRPE